MGKDGQPGFTDYEVSMVKNQAKRENFLSVMEEVVAWEKLEKLLKPFYGKEGRTVGRHPDPLG